LKGSRYGTIVVDLERHEVVDVIHDRSAGPVRSVRPGRQAGCFVGTAT
jgi:transposase